MNTPKWLIVIGGAFLLVGILMAFLSSNYNSKLMSEAQKGVAVLAPEKDSPEWQEKERLFRWVNCWFYLGLVLTFCGVVLQTVGSILPLKRGSDTRRTVDNLDPGPPDELFSNQSLPTQNILVGRINERWRQLHALEKEWAERAVQYLFLTNAGGAIATLSFLGASEKAFNRTGLKWSLALFVGGLILVGFVMAKTYYHMSGLFKHYRRAVDSYFHDQITWDDMNRQDARRSEDKFVGHVLPWAAFLFFALGCIVGGYSLFG
jgi:uncharacterized membrane protein